MAAGWMANTYQRHADIDTDIQRNYLLLLRITSEKNQQTARYLEWAMEYYGVDALMYPPMNQPVPITNSHPAGYLTYSSLSALSGMPAMIVQSGFTKSGLPMAMTLLSHRWSEARLIRYAYAYQVHYPKRVPPKSAPPLPASKSKKAAKLV
jgi:amidase